MTVYPMGCLDETTLLEFAHGKLNTVQLARVEMHLDFCSVCRQVAVLAASQPAATPSQSDENNTNALACAATRPTGSGHRHLHPGDAVGHYRILRLAGAGGMGEVYLARDSRLGRKVALKLLRSAARADAVSLEQFAFEARATAKFNHPHIITIFDVGDHDGMPYVALEYLDGGTLRTRMCAGRLGQGEVLRVSIAIADAVAEAHAHGIVHRDLKPDNVLMPADGRVRVADFGLAGLAHTQEARRDDEAERTEASAPAPSVCGTPLYMAPEQWSGLPPTPAVDVWALGLILYECLDGRHPFSGTSMQDLPQRCHVVPRLEGDSPADLVQLVSRCLETAPTNRPTAKDVAKELRRILSGRNGDGIDEHEGPFRGLLPFSEDQAGWFFGRDAEINQTRQRLQHEPGLTIVGPSGTGKSSLVRAGLIPRLRDSGAWVVKYLRPGSRPLHALVNSLVAPVSTPS